MLNDENNSPVDNIVQEEEKKEMSPAGHMLEVLKFFVLALIIVAPIRFFVAQPFIVQGKSMDPTFETGQYLIVDELTYRFEKPQRGDVIVLRYPKDTDKYFIKRIIGLPGETLTISEGQVSIITKQKETIVLDEPYVTFAKTDIADNETIVLADHKESDANDEYFVMGDNRAASLDSRVWGTLPERLIVGRAYVRLFPFNTIDYLPGQHMITEDSLQ
jgi:signal peptidase I